jgi:hypothetical protein
MYGWTLQATACATYQYVLLGLGGEILVEREPLLQHHSTVGEKMLCE